MRARKLTIRLVLLAMAASLFVPFALFVFASWIDYQNLLRFNDERLLRSLDVEQEEADKTFQFVNLALDNVHALVAEMSASDMQSREAVLHERLKNLVAAVPVAQSIWIYGPDGQALVTSRAHPPPDRKFADRDFFLAHIKASEGDYFGRVYQSVFDAKPFFTVSRRLESDGVFVGVIEISISPSSFFRMFSEMAYAEGQQFALIREDGYLLARYPAAPAGAPDRLDENTGFRRTISVNPAGGTWRSTSPIDHTDRRFAARPIAGANLYITAGIAVAAIRSAWIREMAIHLIFGVPATCLLFLSLLLVLRRTQSLYNEIDQRMAAEDSLRQSQRLDAIGHLTGGVAHDFNNLLTVIIGNLELAQRQASEWSDAGHGKLMRRLESAIHGAQRAAALTKRLLAFSRQQPLNPAPTDINRLLNGLSEFLHRTLGEHISVEIVGGAGLWLVEVDAPELESAILNLAVNARDAMPDGGKLTIEAGNSYLDDDYCRRNAGLRPGQYVLVAVSDTGVGMAKDVVDRAFEPFFTTKQAGQGTGLGLSQVYGFVKQSGGHIKIYSEVGEGSTAKIYLPRFLGQPAEEHRAEHEPTRDQKGECILVVEDDDAVRAYIVETLRELAYEVFEAGNAHEARKIFDRHQHIRLLLTDIVMPGDNGRKLADEAQRRLPDLKVLFMTGYSRNAIVHQGRLDVGVELIQKPLTRDQLAKGVRKALDASEH